MLQALFEAAGVAPLRAQLLVDAIADYRDADHQRRANGAEDDDYATAGLSYDAEDMLFAMTEYPDTDEEGSVQCGTSPPPAG